MPNQNPNTRDINAEIYAKILLSAQSRLILLQTEVNGDADLCVRLDPQQHDELRLISLDLSRKIRTLTDWINDLRHEYGVRAIPEKKQ